MRTKTKTTGDRNYQPFQALEVALEIVGSLRGVVWAIRRHDVKLAQQIVASASSVAANLAEGNRRSGRDRASFFRIAAGSADETRTHLRVAMAWGFIQTSDTEAAMQLLDRELAMLWRLTH